MDKRDTEKNKKTILTELGRRGIKELQVEYSGSGDDGSIESVLGDGKELEDEPVVTILKDGSTFDEGAKKWIRKTATIGMSLEDAVTEFSYEWLRELYAGWENNDGASGTITIDVLSGEFRMNHTTYYTDHETQEHTHGTPDRPRKNVRKAVGRKKRRLSKNP